MIPEMEGSSIGVRLRRIGLFTAVLLVCLLIAAVGWQRFKPARNQAHPPMWLTSASFSDGGSIPSRYTCDGEDLSPALQWSDPPAATNSFVIVMNDPDAPIDFTHWIAYNIPSGVWSLAEGASSQGSMPRGAAQGTDGFSRFGYAGPCPPLGKPHHYVFHIYALDIPLELPPGVTRRQLDAAIGSHILAEGRITGTYQHASQ